MKKVLFMVAALACCAAMQAQIVSSRSSIVKKEKMKSDLTWFVKAGVNFMNFGGDGGDDADMKVGYNAVFGFQDPIGTNGAYWGMDLGFGSRGAGDVMAHNVQYSPFTFGWMIELGDKIKLDPHVAVYLSCDMAKNDDWWDYADDYGDNIFDVGMNIGAGIWFGRFNLDLTYQRGFINAFEDMGGVKTSNVLLRLGVSF